MLLDNTKISDTIVKARLWEWNQTSISKGNTSCKYIDHIVSYIKKEPNLIWVKNPCFAYPNLSPYNDNDMEYCDYMLIKEQIKKENLIKKEIRENESKKSPTI